MKGLYVILDPEHCAGRDALWVAEQALRGGCAALQLRAKQMPDAARLRLARALKQRCSDAGVPFWVNDRLDIALLCDADGLHLGQDDVPLSDARKLWGDRPLGLSTHTLPQASTAQMAGAHVIGFGPTPGVGVGFFFFFPGLAVGVGAGVGSAAAASAFWTWPRM